MTALVLTTNPGLEDCAFEELADAASGAAWAPGELSREDSGVAGRLLVRASRPEPDLTGLARLLRSVHHLHRPLHRFRLEGRDPLQEIETAFQAVDLSMLGPGTPFRISSRRQGGHAFTSHDVQRVAGAAVVARTGAPVDLTRFRVELCVDVLNATVVVTQRLTRRPLSLRPHWPSRPRVSLRANVAHCALRLAGLGPRSRAVGDPFCGSGTVLLEAGSWLPRIGLWGGDIAERAVERARHNLAATGLAQRARVVTGDAHEAGEWLPGGLDAIVTNPPYGQRLGRGIRFRSFYADFLREAARVLRPGGRVVLLATRGDALRKALRETGTLRLLTVVPIETGELHPRLFVLELPEASS